MLSALFPFMILLLSILSNNAVSKGHKVEIWKQQRSTHHVCSRLAVPAVRHTTTILSLLASSSCPNLPDLCPHQPY
jgi:hypothetical protein